jgi:hypothetical protein
LAIERAFDEQASQEAYEPVVVNLPAVQQEPIEDVPVQHDDNLADILEEGDLRSIGSDIVSLFESDKTSRSDWYRTYIKGLDSLGMKIEERTEPWDGACGVFHPILSEAVVRFQSNAIVELFPAAGPVKPLLLGRETPEKIEQARRVSEEMNYQLTENMPEYRSETEQLLFRLPLAGSCFRKVYFDGLNGRPSSMMVSAEDFIVDYATTDLDTCERATHVMRKSSNEVRKLQVAGLYSDIALSQPTPELTETREKEDSLSGSSKTYEQENTHVILEVHIDYDLPGEFADEAGIARPYIITVDKSTSNVLSIYRNWREDDPSYKRRDYFVRYLYTPGFGFYGFGLIHLLGSIAKSSTAILRQLVDAGTLSNLPGGLKTKGLRTTDEDEPIRPGEWRDISVPAGSIRDNIFALPYKEPSGVLYQLLNTIVEEGRRIGSIADVEVGEMKENAPVGTVLALLERSMKVMSAVHARIHASLRKELKLISNVILENMPAQYDWDLEQKFNRQQDFDGRVDIIPVSDPNAATMSAKVVQFQAVMQMVQANPDIYNLPEVHKSGLEILGVKEIERLIPAQDPPPPLDPVTENMNVLTGKPIQAYMEQDHEAHLQTHLNAMFDPKMQQIIGQSPNAQMVQSAMEAHIAEHLGFQYRSDIEQRIGSQLPPPGEQLPPEVEVGLSRLIAKASDKLREDHEFEMQEKEAEELRKDPAFQLREREVATKEMQAQHKAIMDENKALSDIVKAAAKDLLEREKIRSEERKTAARIGADMAMSEENLTSTEKTEGLRIGKDIARDIRQDVRETQRMTQEANERASNNDTKED